jgi:hypothetical protein
VALLVYKGTGLVAWLGDARCVLARREKSADGEAAAAQAAGAPSLPKVAEKLNAFAVSKAGNATESLTDIALFLQAGDYLTITATSTNANDVAATIVWIEDI